MRLALGPGRCTQNNLMSRFTKTVSTIESTIDQSRQPGRKRTCVRSPGRFQITNIAQHAGGCGTEKTGPAEAPARTPAGQTQRAARRSYYPAHGPLLATVSVAVFDVLGVRITRSGLRQTAADEVSAGDDGDIKPCLPRDELVGPVGVPALDHGGADENRGNYAHHSPELRGLERLLRLGRQAAKSAIPPNLIGAYGTGLCCCFHAFHTSLFLVSPAWAVQEDRSHSRPFAPRLDEPGHCRVSAKQAAPLWTLTLRSTIQTSVRVGPATSPTDDSSSKSARGCAITLLDRDWRSHRPENPGGPPCRPRH